MSDILKEVDEVEEMIVDGVHNYSTEDQYVRPTDPSVLEKLEWFQDQKLALMMHWGPYCQLGLVESWALSDADGDWSRHQLDWVSDTEEFKRDYFDLNKTFNPIRFQPKAWADFAKEVGMKYMIFTTKHHDGFCMWDTKYTDYKTTNEDCPFHKHKYADICKHLFDAFRENGLGIAAYFSKADWHIDSYWKEGEERGTKTSRGPSYKPSERPEVWEEFVTFTQNQIKELGTEYGPLDIMWFDAGWVCESNGQDIRLGEVIDEVRKTQKGMLCADRTIGGAYENYVTPEQCVPEQPLSIPWESCITLGNSFSFNYEDDYKSPREVTQLLIDIVAKGGNLAINVGPQPDGRMPKGAIKTLEGMGEFLKIYGEGIYGTRVCAPYKKENIAFTKKGDTVYAFEMFDSETSTVPETVLIPYQGEVKKVILLGEEKELSYTTTAEGIQVEVPQGNENIAPMAAPVARVYKII